MRSVSFLLVLLSFAVPALADDIAKTDIPITAPAPAASSTGASAGHADTSRTDSPSVDGSQAPALRRHPKWEDHFDKANLSHNGHLTLEEARAGYRTIARHFQDIDVDNKGYVTENDIRAWHALQKASHAHRGKSDDTLRPQHAFQEVPQSHQHPLNTSTTQTVMLPDAFKAAVQSQ